MCDGGPATGHPSSWKGYPSTCAPHPESPFRGIWGGGAPLPPPPLGGGRGGPSRRGGNRFAADPADPRICSSRVVRGRGVREVTAQKWNEISSGKSANPPVAVPNSGKTMRARGKRGVSEDTSGHVPIAHRRKTSRGPDAIRRKPHREGHTGADEVRAGAGDPEQHPLLAPGSGGREGDRSRGGALGSIHRRPGGTGPKGEALCFREHPPPKKRVENHVRLDPTPEGGDRGG